MHAQQSIFANRAWGRCAALFLGAGVFLAGCSSVDLTPQRQSPPILNPHAPGPVAARGPDDGGEPLPAGVQVQPVTQPGQPPAGTISVTTDGEIIEFSAPPGNAATDHYANLVTFSTRLNAGNVLPPTSSSASGRLDALYDTQTRLLRWKAQWHGLSAPVIGVQYHGPASAGQVAGAVVVWPGPFGSSYEGRVTLSPEQASDLRSGHWYVNVLTSAYPAGEIRGQLREVR
ncbi:MAG: CHRD domain-containing protein [Burkholderiaceae bacterium]|jgi:hypothetical protein|nr:CHRD domain-containing protein [Burkholderiaceae bacterium]